MQVADFDVLVVRFGALIRVHIVARMVHLLEIFHQFANSASKLYVTPQLTQCPSPLARRIFEQQDSHPNHGNSR